MPRSIGLELFFVLLIETVIQADSLNSIVFIYNGEAGKSVMKDSIRQLEGFDIKTYVVNQSTNLERIRSDVCSVISDANNLMMMLDYSGARSINALLEGISQRLKLPYLRMGSAFQMPHSICNFQLQLHPGANIQLLLVKDYLLVENEALRWDNGVIILSENTTDLENYATLTQNADAMLTVRKWSSSEEENHRMLQEVGGRSVRNNFIVGLEPKELKEFFALASAMRYLTYSNRFLLTHEEASSVNLKAFAYGEANITTFRLKIDQKGGHLPVQLAKVARSLMQYAGAAVTPSSSWKLRCDSEPWEQGDKAMTGLMRAARSTYGLIKNLNGITCPIVNYKLDIVTLLSNGFNEVSTWKFGEGFKFTEKASTQRLVRRTRQVKKKKLIVTTIESVPFVIYDAKKKGNARFSGMCISLLEKLCKDIIGCEYEIRLVKDGKYGRMMSPKNWTGMVGELVDKAADIAVGPITVTYERSRVIDFSQSFMNAGLKILFRKPRLLKSRPSFMEPLAAEVWVLTIIGLIITSLVLFVTARLSPAEWQIKHHGDHHRGHPKVNQFTLAKSFWFITGGILFRGTNLVPKAISTRLVSLTWWWFVLLLVVVYAFTMNNFLKVEKMQYPIKKFLDLTTQTKIKYGALKGGSTYAFFKRSEYPTYKFAFQQMVFVNEITDGVGRVIEGNYALIMESSMAEYYTARNCGLTVIGPQLNSQSYAFAFVKDSPYRDQFSQGILKLLKLNIIDEYRRFWMYKYKIKVPCRDEDDSNPIPSGGLGLDTLCGLFGWLFIGLLVSLIVCLVEVCLRACRPADRGQRSVQEYFTHQFRLLCCTWNGVSRDDHGEAEATDQPLKEIDLSPEAKAS